MHSGRDILIILNQAATKERDKMALTNEDLQALANLMDNKLQPINNRLDKIESEVSSIKANQLELKKEVREIKHKVTDTYELALDAWGTSTENRNWLEHDKLKA